MSPFNNAVAKGCGAAAVASLLVLASGTVALATQMVVTEHHVVSQNVVLTSLNKTSVCHHKKECAVGDDGMAYQITSARRYRDVIGSSGVAIGFTIYNTSKHGHQFSPLNGGFAAVMKGGGIVASFDYEGGASGNPRCYSSSEIEPSGTDATTYFVRRGQKLRMPEMCFIPTAGLKVTSVQLASDDANNPVNIRLTSPV